MLGQGTGPSGVSAVWGLAIDAHGDLFIADELNQRIQELVDIASSSSLPPAPTITGITPTKGPAAGGAVVTITGTNLSGGAVSFGSTAATGASCSASSCTATSPTGTGTVDITVATTAGISATRPADQFTYQAAPPPAPTISSISPTSGTTAGGTSVTISGTNLASASSVDFGSSGGTITSDGAAQIVATTPAGAASRGQRLGHDGRRYGNRHCRLHLRHATARCPNDQLDQPDIWDYNRRDVGHRHRDEPDGG